MQDQGGAPAAPITLQPGVIFSYSHGWKQLWKHFLGLLLIFLVTIGFGALSWVANLIHYVGGLAYSIFFTGPLGYGASYAYLKASRNESVEVQDMFTGFKNYWNVVGAYVLTSVIVLVGLIFVIVPGIYFACKLAFVPYLVVDKKMGVTEALKASWNMTNGHGWKVFLIGLLAIPIFIAGLICLGVGVIISGMWISTALATLYYAVSTETSAGAPASISPQTPIIG
jgi:uncharacterized membrane protein